MALDNLVTFQLSPALSGYDKPRAMAFFDQLLDNLRAVPGVKTAALAAVPILSGDEWDNSMSVEGHQAKDGENMQAFMNALSPGYFAAMGIPILEGRDFNRTDVKENATTAIVNRQLRRSFLPRHERDRQAHRQRHRPQDEAEHRDRRRRRQRALRGAARRGPAAGLRPELGQRGA